MITLNGHIIYWCVLCVDGIHIIPSGDLLSHNSLITTPSAAVVVLMSELPSWVGRLQQADRRD